MLSPSLPPFPFSRCYGVGHHFTGPLEKVHRPAKYTKPIGLQMAVQVLPGILQNAAFILILHTPGADQGKTGFGQE
jgi:hypothetical protein